MCFISLCHHTENHILILLSMCDKNILSIINASVSYTFVGLLLRFSPKEKLFFQLSLLVKNVIYLPLTFTIIQLHSLPLSVQGISQLLSSSEPSLNPHPSHTPDFCHTRSSPPFSLAFSSLW